MERRRLIWAFIVGALAVEFLVSWLMPKAIVWYFNPPVAMGCDCHGALQWAFDRMRVFQLWGFAIGGILGLVVVAGLKRRSSRQLPMQHR